MGRYFNCNINFKNDESYKKLRKRLNKLDLVNVWPHKNPLKNSLTWCDAENNPKSMIYYIFVNNDFIGWVKNTSIIDKMLSGTHNKTHGSN